MSTPPSAPTSSRSSPPPPAVQVPEALRHMQSNSILVSPASNRVSQLLSPSKTGSRSPTSIPSSPTSVHSSSSAIFERDIEPGPLSSPSALSTSLHSTNRDPHRIPRAKTTETLEQSVPSVLDSAAEILANLPDSEVATLDSVAVEAPALFDTASPGTGRRSGFTSPIGSLRSRSPSPMGRTSLLLSIPPQQQQQQTPTTGGLSPTAQRDRLAVSTSTSAAATTGTNTPPSIITPTSTYFSTASSVESSPKTTTREQAPQLPASPTSVSTAHTTTSPTTTTAVSHPPSPTHVATKRLSFMSYNDLLGGTPASTLPLSVLTSSVTTSEPPPHIPSVSGFQPQSHSLHSPIGSGGGGGSTTASLHGFPLDPPPLPKGNRDSIVLLDEVGGEWEREGLGRGLEERLEGLMGLSAASQSPVVQKA